jgi:TolB-like protein
MNSKLLAAVVCGAVSVLAVGCTSNKRTYVPVIMSQPGSNVVIDVEQLDKVVTSVAKELSKSMKASGHAGTRILVGSFTDLSDVTKTSPVALATSERLAVQLTKQGFRVIEPRLSSSLKFQGGEILLSRLEGDVSPSFEPNFVVVGTYARVADGWIFSAKVVNPETQDTVAAANFALQTP